MIIWPFSTRLTVSPSTIPLSNKIKVRLSALKLTVRITFVFRDATSAAGSIIFGAGGGIFADGFCCSLTAVRSFAGVLDAGELVFGVLIAGRADAVGLDVAEVAAGGMAATGTSFLGASGSENT